MADTRWADSYRLGGVRVQVWNDETFGGQMNNRTARFIKNLNMRGDARLFELSSPMKYDAEETKFVVVSAIIAPYSGAETYIFPADVNGAVLDWGELEGSFRGNLDHKRALNIAGFKIIE